MAEVENLVSSPRSSYVRLRSIFAGLAFALLVWTDPNARGQSSDSAVVASPRPESQAQESQVPSVQAAQPSALVPVTQAPIPVKADLTQTAEGDSLTQAPVPLVPAKKTYTVPAGTKVLLQLRSAINTKSAKPGDGIYLASTFPVVVGSRVLIPAGVYVQGIVDNVVRPGRVKGRAQLNLHFSSIIFPNGTVVEIPGIINSLPGAHDRTVDAEGKVEQNGNKGHDVAEAAKIGLEGAGIGGLGGAISGHPLEGAAIGGLGGVAVGTVIALFTRGNDINIENGTPVEMVLQRPLVLEESNLSASVPTGGIGSGNVFLPAQSQPRPLDKPTIRPSQILCPPGGLGCP